METLFFLFFFLFVIVFIIILSYTGTKGKERFLSNLERLGVKLDRKMIFIPRADWNFKGLKARYVYNLLPIEDLPGNSLSLFHQRPLNLGIYLTNSDSLFPDHSSAYHTGIASKRKGCKEIGLSGILKERLIRCWVVNERFGRSMLSDERVKSSIAELSDILESYNGKFLINDSHLVMAFERESQPDAKILDAAYNLSMAMGSSGAISPISPPLPITDRIFHFIIIALLIAVIGVVIFTIYSQ